MAKLSDNQLIDALQTLPGWEVIDGEIVRVFKLGAYADHLAFVSIIGRLADRADHHPDILLTYPSVRVSLSTHSEGGITEKDTSLATAIDKVAGMFG